MNRAIGRRFVTDSYREKIDRIAAAQADLSRGDVEERFVEQCREFERFLKDDAPKGVIQRAAWQTMERNL